MFNRRQMMTGAAAGLSLFAAPALIRAQGFRRFPFSLGIAAGDPAHDGFVIWTRLAPDPLDTHGGMGMSPMTVNWEVAADSRFEKIVRKGETLARPELAHSVHVEVDGLEPDRPYWYRFVAGGERSFHGRARTLPREGAALGKVKFGVAGCQSFEDGYYTAYRHLAREELAFVYHYGDYIYENRGGPTKVSRGGSLIVTAREHEGDALYDIADYRRRYAQYKQDGDLQRAHAAHAFIATFDDHEVADNWVQDKDAADTPPELFRTRRAAALQAWYEHMPVRRARFPRFGEVTAHRRARIGDLIDMSFLDTRQYRSDQPCGGGFQAICPGIDAPDAAVLGAEQEAWLGRNLKARGARWTCLAQQIMMMSLDRRTRGEPDKVVNHDSWAGYEVPRRRLLARMSGLDNVVVLTGDEHQNFAGLLHDRDRPVAVEFVATSISSGGDGNDQRGGSDRLFAGNPQLKFTNDRRGYLTCEVTPDEWQTHFMTVDRVTTPGADLTKRATFAVAHGKPELRLVEQLAPPPR